MSPGGSGRRCAGMRDEGRASYPGRPAGLAPATVPPTAPRTKYHPWFQSFLEARGYYDVFLIDAHGLDTTMWRLASHHGRNHGPASGAGAGARSRI